MSSHVQVHDPDPTNVPEKDSRRLMPIDKTSSTQPNVRTISDQTILRDNLTKTEPYTSVMARIDHHIKISNEQITRYGRWALRIRYLLPFLSALATGFATFTAGFQRNDLTRWLAWAVAALSFVATVVSALNSAIRPSVQYAHYVRYINRFWHVKMEIEFDLDDVALQASNLIEAERELCKRLLKRNEEVEDIINTFSDASITNIGIPQQHAQGASHQLPFPVA
jgi:hypothetical protein